MERGLGQDARERVLVVIYAVEAHVDVGDGSRLGRVEAGALGQEVAGDDAQAGTGGEAAYVHPAHVHVGVISLGAESHSSVGPDVAGRRRQGELGGVVLACGGGVALHQEWRQVEVFQLKQALHRAGLHEVAVEVEVGVELGGLHDVGNATVGAQVDEAGHLYL